MSARIISQREAHRLVKRVQKLEDERDRQRRRWSSEYPGGTHLGYISHERDWFSGRLEAAQILKHAIVCRVDDSGKINFYACELPK